ncbi:MAG: rRNA pseudouridine synthase, partial [Gemmatimonadales bacterium]|nr:rRNA pseudouridine synthase [Gemmatimonadales bacterium]
VDPAVQRITVVGRAIRRFERRWLALHKPLGVVTTARDEKGRPTVFDLVDRPQGLNYVGRLDIATTGLLLLTTDGEAAHRLTHPKYRVPRRYTALVHGKPTQELESLVGRRITIDGRVAKPESVRVRPGRQGRSIIDVTFTEGRNRLVRRWCEALGLKVERLARMSYGPIRLADLEQGHSRPLTPREIAALYRAIGLPEEAQAKH